MSTELSRTSALASGHSELDSGLVDRKCMGRLCLMHCSEVGLGFTINLNVNFRDKDAVISSKGKERFVVVRIAVNRKETPFIDPAWSCTHA